MTTPLYSGVRSYFTFDGAVQPHDDSNQGNDGVLVDAGAVAGGIFGKALRLTAADGVLDISGLGVGALVPRPQISISVWINPDAALDAMWGTPMFADKRNGLAKGYALGCLTPGSRDVSFQIYNAAGTAYTATFTETATGPGWIHYVGTYVGSVVTLYRNGTVAATAIADGTMTQNTTSDLLLCQGFEGLFDEFVLWNRGLSAGDVTALYNGGAGLQITWPTLVEGPDLVETFRDGHSAYSYTVEENIAALPPVIAADAIVPALDCRSLATPYLSGIPTPYPIVDSPGRIFINPNPVIASVTVDNSFHITAVGIGGPTDAYQLLTWWQIELEGGVLIIIADQTSTVGAFETRHTVTDFFDIPFGQDWENLNIFFVMQAADDATQTWYSAPFKMLGAGFNNGQGKVAPVYPLPPGPPAGPGAGPVIGPKGPGAWSPRTRDFSIRRF